MAAIAWADVTAHAAELSTVAVGAQTDILAHVNTAFAVSVFGGEDAPKLKLARIYLAAHMAKSGKLAASGAAGPVTSETADNISRSYAVAMASSGSDTWSSTGYGRLLAQLVRTSSARLPRVF
jgi:uncharacterized protein YfaP (DUF2135 family)